MHIVEMHAKCTIVNNRHKRTGTRITTQTARRSKRTRTSGRIARRRHTVPGARSAALCCFPVRRSVLCMSTGHKKPRTRFCYCKSTAQDQQRPLPQTALPKSSKYNVVSIFVPVSRPTSDLLPSQHSHPHHMLSRQSPRPFVTSLSFFCYPSLLLPFTFGASLPQHPMRFPSQPLSTKLPSSYPYASVINFSIPCALHLLNLHTTHFLVFVMACLFLCQSVTNASPPPMKARSPTRSV
jgi:hypothetical protein